MGEVEEKVRLDNSSVGKLLNQTFFKKITELEEGIEPAFIILVKNKDNKSIPLIINHQNSKEVEDKIIHIESADQEFLNKIKNIIQSL